MCLRLSLPEQMQDLFVSLKCTIPSTKTYAMSSAMYNENSHTLLWKYELFVSSVESNAKHVGSNTDKKIETPYFLLNHILCSSAKIPVPITEI